MNEFKYEAFSESELFQIMHKIDPDISNLQYYNLADYKIKKIYHNKELAGYAIIDLNGEEKVLEDMSFWLTDYSILADFIHSLKKDNVCYYNSNNLSILEITIMEKCKLKALGKKR